MFLYQVYLCFYLTSTGNQKQFFKIVLVSQNIVLQFLEKV